MSDATIEITRDNFKERVERSGIVLLDWWASWCGPCRVFAPIFEAAAERHPEVTFGKIDTEAESALASALDIRAIPTLMVLRDGVLLASQAGVMPGEALDALIGEARALDMDEVRVRLEEQQAQAGQVEARS